MTRARNLSKLSNPNVFTVDTSNNVGVGSSMPDVKLDVDGDAHIGAAITMYSTSGIVSATSFFGSAEGLTDLPAGGASLSASSGNQRVVVTSLTSGTMTAAGTNADLAYNTTTNTLSATTFSGALTGNVTGNASGSSGSCTGNSATATVATNAQGLTGTPDITIQNVTGVAGTFTGFVAFSTSISVGGTITYEDVTNVDSIGVITARAGVQVGSGQSFGANGPTAVYYGDGSNLTGISVGLSTEAFTSSGIVTAVRLSTAQDHKITATGLTTITSSGSGTEGESHTIRIVNSGIATVGFSTYFLFPSGAAPSLPTADGAISLISFTVHDSVGAGCTQLLAGASVNYS